jgi:hypothetical protein
MESQFKKALITEEWQVGPSMEKLPANGTGM